MFDRFGVLGGDERVRRVCTRATVSVVVHPKAVGTLRLRAEVSSDLPDTVAANNVTTLDDPVAPPRSRLP